MIKINVATDQGVICVFAQEIGYGLALHKFTDADQRAPWRISDIKTGRHVARGASHTKALSQLHSLESRCISSGKTLDQFLDDARERLNEDNGHELLH